MATLADRKALGERNRRVGLLALLAGLAMLGLGYAAVPLYQMFCQATGYGGTTQKALGAEAPGEVIGKIVNVRFDANVAPALPWEFTPEQRVQRVAIGARQMAFFNAKNVGDHEITGTASFNVTPEQSGKYFTKIQCFCFTNQTLKPGESIRMPVIFYIDPKMIDDPDANDISEITLSYTFFPVPSEKAGG